MAYLFKEDLFFFFLFQVFPDLRDWCERRQLHFVEFDIRWVSQGFWIYLYFRIRHSFAHLRLVILSADWSICRLQSWTCSSLTTVAEFVKLTQSIVIEIQRQSADLYKVQLCNRQFFCGCPSDLRGKGIRVSPAWVSTLAQRGHSDMLVYTCVKKGFEIYS